MNGRQITVAGPNSLIPKGILVGMETTLVLVPGTNIMHILFGYIVESEVGENFLGVGPYGGLAHPARLVLRPVE